MTAFSILPRFLTALMEKESAPDSWLYFSAWQAAISAAEAVESAKLAAQAMVKAQAAQTAAEEAARVAKEAQEKAEEAQRKAEEAQKAAKEAAEAASEAIKMAEDNKTAYGLLDWDHYSDMFYTVDGTTIPWSKETLWGKYNTLKGNGLINNTLGRIHLPESSVYGGNAVNCTPTQNYVDLFEMNENAAKIQETL